MPCFLYPVAVNVKTQVEREPLPAGALGGPEVPSASLTRMDKKHKGEINMSVYVCARVVCVYICRSVHVYVRVCMCPCMYVRVCAHAKPQRYLFYCDCSTTQPLPSGILTAAPFAPSSLGASFLRPSAGVLAVTPVSESLYPTMCVSSTQRPHT